MASTDERVAPAGSGADPYAGDNSGDGGVMSLSTAAEEEGAEGTNYVEEPPPNEPPRRPLRVFIAPWFPGPMPSFPDLRLARVG